MIDRLKVSVREGARDPWWLITLGVLVVCLAARLVLLDADTLDYDSYILMTGVEKSFPVYLEKMASYSLPMRVHYWISYRLFGGDLSGYLILPVAASLATVGVIYVGLNRYWRTATGIVFFTLCLFAFNGHSFYLASYAMFPYAFSLLVSSVLYFTFLHFSSNLRARIRWYWIPIAVIPAAFFTNLITAIPVLSGLASILLYRWYRIPESRNVEHVLHYLNSIWPLLIFPITYIVVYTIFPFENLGLDKRPDMAEYFYSSSSVQSAWGMVLFLIHGTANLCWQLFSPSPPAALVGQQLSTFLRPILSILLLGLLCGWACVRLKILKCSNNSFKFALFTESPPLFFTLIYLGVMYSAIAVGGLSGLYPFGSVRYASYLLIPALIVVGYFSSWATVNISSCFGVDVRWRKAFLGIASFLVVLGVFTIVSNHNKYMQDRAEINAVFESIRRTDAEIVLVGNYPAPALRHFVPNIYVGNKAMSIGWGTFWGHGSDGGVPQELTKLLIKGNEVSAPAVKRMLTIASSRQQYDEIYPSYSHMIGKYYRLEQEIKATNIWAGTYVKK